MKANTSKLEYGGITISILPREGKTKEYRSRTSIIQIHPSPYIYDCQIMTLNASICHKDEYKRNDNHNTI